MLKLAYTPPPCNICGGEAAITLFRKNGYDLVRCSNCGLVFVANPPTQSELEELYSFASGYHAVLADENSPECRIMMDRARGYYRTLARRGRTGRLLDVGCSAGFFLKVAADNGWECCGVEMSNDTAEIARSRYGLAVTTGTIEQAAYPPGSFDVITLFDIVEHVRDVTAFMDKVRELLKDDGIILISTPNIDGLFPSLSYKMANKLGYWPHPEPPLHLYQFSKRSIQALLARTGFSPIEIVDRGIPVTNSLGGFKQIIRSPKRLLYTALFAPTILLGPLIRRGDIMTVVASKDKPRTES